MKIFPAVDIKGGRCVRLAQGRAGQETVFEKDAVFAATRWSALGGEALHLVDLDGAFQGYPVNLTTVRRICDCLSVPAQLGGGLRDEEAVGRALDAGVERVILGTRAVLEPEWLEEMCRTFAGRILADLSAKDGLAQVKGWTEGTSVRAVDLATRFAQAGVAAIVFTDVVRDGMLRGPNFAAIEEIAEHSPVPVIASGGVSSLEDVERLARMPLEGIVIGKALYTKAFSLPEAIAAAQTKE